jgi:hypothetical protein
MTAFLSMMRSSVRAVTLLPEPLSPTRAERATLAQLERHVAHGVEDAGAQPEIDAEVFDLEDDVVVVSHPQLS